MSTIISAPHERTPMFSTAAKSIQDPAKSDEAMMMKKKKTRYGTLAAVLSGLAFTALSGYQYSTVYGGGGGGGGGGDSGGIQATTSLVSMENKMGSALDLASTAPCEVTCKEHYIHQDYKCSDTRSTMVCYPSSSGDYPIVLYQRGSGGWDGDGDKSFITSMAEQCLIVIAPMTSWTNSGKASCQTNEDLITAYHDAKDNWKAKEAWNIQTVTPNWDRIGAAGHSAGAHHLPTFQMLFYKKYTKRINAVMFSHGGSPDDRTSSHYKPDLNNCLTWYNATASDGKSICAGVPAFFLTSPKDGTVEPEWTKNWYTKLTKVVKHVVYVEANSAYYGHDEPTHLRKSGGYGILNAYTGRFLACHLYESGTIKSEACDYIYGKSSSEAICSYKSTVKGTCKVTQP